MAVAKKKKVAKKKAKKKVQSVCTDEAPPLILGYAEGGRATVRREYDENGVIVWEEIEELDESDLPTIATRLFATPPARVSVSGSLSVNMGDYESAKSMVTLSLPCYPEEVDACYKYADKWVTKILKKDVKKAQRHSDHPKYSDTPRRRRTRKRRRARRT